MAKCDNLGQGGREGRTERFHWTSPQSLRKINQWAVYMSSVYDIFYDLNDRLKCKVNTQSVNTIGRCNHVLICKMQTKVITFLPRGKKLLFRFMHSNRNFPCNCICFMSRWRTQEKNAKTKQIEATASKSFEKHDFHSFWLHVLRRPNAGPAHWPVGDVRNSRYKSASGRAAPFWGAGSPTRQSCSSLDLLTLAVDMAEAFVGTWNLMTSEKFDDYMKELGECEAFGVHLREHACARVKGRWMLPTLHAAACGNGAKGSF